MMSGITYQYYVEGQDEKKLVDTLKSNGYIVSGKVEVFNVLQEPFTLLRIRPLKQNTVVILIFDTDVEMVEVLIENIKFLKRQKNVKEIWCVTQVKNLED